MAIKQMFTDKDLDDDFIRFEMDAMQEAIQKLAFVGEEFVKAARLNTNIPRPDPPVYPHDKSGFYDWTNNLRSSIGYIIALDGDIVDENFEGNADGVQAAKDTANELLQEYKTGLVLIGFAGMEYALAVESRGYDVITGSIPAAAEILNELMK